MCLCGHGRVTGWARGGRDVVGSGSGYNVFVYVCVDMVVLLHPSGKNLQVTCPHEPLALVGRLNVNEHVSGKSNLTKCILTLVGWCALRFEIPTSLNMASDKPRMALI